MIIVYVGRTLEHAKLEWLIKHRHISNTLLHIVKLEDKELSYYITIKHISKPARTNVQYKGNVRTDRYILYICISVWIFSVR
jgi:hypothetical protein